MTIRQWSWLHKWSSIVCTAFMLLLCITGAPLIFHEEIEHLSGVTEAPPLPAGTPMVSMDAVAEAALKARPGDVIRYMIWDQEEHPDLTLISMAHSHESPPDENFSVVIDSRTAKVLDQPKTDEGFMYVMLKLHVDMFAGLPGMLFLGLMGLFFVVAIVSGIVLYKPFMRKLEFGTVRRQRSRRLKWLDYHNLIGIVTIVWALVVGVTGSINTLSQVLLGLWQMDQLAEMVAPYKDQPAPQTLGSIAAALKTARELEPDMKVAFVAFPGTMLTSKHHYMVAMKGTSPLMSRMIKPALIDTQTGALTDSRELPWYMKTLLLSQPLHFGDYGGMPLKIIWLLLDLVTIVVLGSGLYLWLRKPTSGLAAASEETAPSVKLGVRGAASGARREVSTR